MNLKTQRAAALKAAQEIVDGAKSAERDLTTEEQSTVTAKFAEVDDLDAKIKAAAESDALMARIGSFGAPEVADRDADKPAKSLGEHFAKSVGSEGFARLKERGGFTVAAPEFKANTDPQLVPGSFGPVLTVVDRTIVRSYRRPVVSDVFGSGSISGNAVTYFVEGAFEGTIATVAENGQKPQIHVADPTAVTDSLKKIAAWWGTKLNWFPDNIKGGARKKVLDSLLNRGGIQPETQAVAPDSAQDAIFRAMTKVQTATGLTADAILINPADYQALRLSKDANGQYFGGGFFSGEYGVGGIAIQPPLWGLRTIVTSAVAAKTVVVGALQSATTVYRKGGVRVESTNSDLGKFTKNVITTRIEERVALAVRIPAAVVKVTLL